MKILFRDFGESLGTRFLGNKIRIDVLVNIEKEMNVVFDFKGVTLLTNSFADECFGKLVEEKGISILKEKTKFVNAEGIVEKVIIKAINDRLLNTSSAS